MIVIIPHPTEELKIIRLQKALLQKLNTSGNIFYAISPLWLELPQNYCGTTKDDLKLVASKITSISTGRLSFFESKVVLTVLLNMDNETLELKLPLLQLYKGNADNLSFSDYEVPVKELKVFRVGNATLLSPVSKAITEFVWKKL